MSEAVVSKVPPWREQGPVLLAGLGHGAIHWTAAVFYLLLPFIAESFSLSYTEAGLLVSLFFAVSFGSNLISGPVVDIWSRKLAVQSVTVAISAAALLCFPVAAELMFLGLLVAVIAIANNFWHPAAISHLSEKFPDHRGYALSIHALGANAGDAAAPVIVGVLIGLAGWQSGAAYAALPVALIALVLAGMSLRERARRRHEAVSLGGGGQSFAGYLVGLKGLFTDGGVLLLCLMAALRTMTQNGLMAFLPLYLAQQTGGSAVQIGLTLGAFQGAGVLAAPVSGTLSDRLGRRGLAKWGLAVAALATFCLLLLPVGWPFLLGSVLLGFAMFSVRPVIHSWLMDLTPVHMGGSATSLLFGAQGVVSIIGPFICGAIADIYGFDWVFVFLGLVMLGSFATAFTVPVVNRTEGQGK